MDIDKGIRITGGDRSILDDMINCYACHKIVLDDDNNPIDYYYVEVNRAFEELLGLKREDIIGKRVTEIFHDITEDAFDWVGIYGRVALKQETVEFKQYFHQLDKWFLIHASSSHIGYFSTIFLDITNEVLREERIKKLTSRTMKYFELNTAPEDNYQMMAEDIREISNATFVMLNIYNNRDGRLVTEAVAGIEGQGLIEKILDFEIVGKTWEVPEEALSLIKKKELINIKNISEASAFQIPFKSGRLIERLYRLQDFYAIGIYHKGYVMGYVIFGVEKDTVLIDKDIIEIFINMIGMALFRSQVEEQLRESQRDLQSTNEELEASLEQLLAAELELRNNYDILQLKEQQLQESEMKWRFALEASGDGIWEWNVQTNEVHYSDRAMEILCYSKDDGNIKLENTEDRVHPEDLSGVKQLLKQHFNRETEVYISEHRIKCSDSSYRWILDRGKVLTWTEEGLPLLMIGTYIDINERKKAEEELKEQKKILESLFRLSPDAIVYLDTLGNVQSINEKFTAIFGYTVDECIGRNLDLLIANESLLQEAHKISERAMANDNIEIETYRSRKDGCLVPVSIRGGSIIVDEKIIGYYGIYTDIKKRLESERALKESEEIYRSIVTAIPDIIIRYSKDGTMLDVNSGETDGLITTKQELVGANARDILPTHVADLILTTIRKTIESQRLTSIEYMLSVPQGERYFEMRQVASGEEEVIAIIRDITDRKQADEKIRYLSFHDKLTGLYNRAFFEEELKRLDNSRQLPLSILIGDVNGLKLTNDVFGHLEGDELLIRIADIMRACCRVEDVVARWGGDEFAVILPNTNDFQANQIMNRIHEACRNQKTEHVQISIAIGSATKTRSEEVIRDIIKEAEEKMYRHKLLESKSARSNIIASLQKTLYERSHETEEHAQRMKNISQMLGRAIGLKENELDELRLLCLLHDIGKIAISDHILTKPGALNNDEWEEMKRHSEIGYRIAESSQELFHIAEYILFHHERWDGSGYPQGLRGNKIPKLSRILAIVDAYDVMTNSSSYKKAISHQEALEEIIKYAGTQFDPELARIFIDIMMGEKG